MPLVVPKVGELADLEYRRLNLFPGLPLGLFQNNFSPTINTVFADVTEANFAGYARVNTTWPLPAALNGFNQAQVIGSPTIFLCNNVAGPFNTVYGYFILRAGQLMWIERFPSPVPILQSGSGVVVTPLLTYFTQFSG